MKRLHASSDFPCHKRTVLATLVASNGDEFSATNQCRVSAPCPRQALPTGASYELCNPVHAEVRAIELAGAAAKGGRLFVEGHDYACAPCTEAALAAGVLEVVVGAPPRRLSVSQDIKDLRGEPS